MPIAIVSAYLIGSVPFALLIAGAARADVRGERSPFRARWIVKLGEWSFAFYLLHQMVLRALAATVFLGRPTGWLFVLTALLVATASAAALYTFVERPLDRRLRA